MARGTTLQTTGEGSHRQKNNPVVAWKFYILKRRYRNKKMMPTTTKISFNRYNAGLTVMYLFIIGEFPP
jgi:hypothetical protein